MALKLKTPLITEQINRMDIDSFSAILSTLAFTYIIGMYFDNQKVRNKIVDVPTGELMPYLIEPLKEGDTIYGAIKRMIYRHAKAHDHMPADAVDETLQPVEPDPTPEPDPEPDPEPSSDPEPTEPFA